MAMRRRTSNQAPTIAADLTPPEPNWEIEMRRTERPVWQVAAMAGNVQPKPKILTAARASKAWRTGYNAMIEDLCNALSPVRSPSRIFYDKDIPANISRINEKEELRNVRVDVGSAARYLVAKIGVESLPDGFQRLHAHFQASSAGADTVVAGEKGIQSASRKPKSQELAAATKKVKALSTLLYAIVEQEFGWTSIDGGSRVGTLRRIEASLDVLDLKSRYALSRDAIEDTLNLAAGTNPLKNSTKMDS
ncbi:hypothetical protein D3C86_1190810 [compost metagenome]